MRGRELLVVALALASGVAAADVRVDPPRDPQDAHTLWRWVGIKASAHSRACPAPNPPAGWTTRPMFPGTDDRRLAQFCVYENQGLQPQPPIVQGLIRLDPDSMSVLPSGGALRDALWHAMADHFASQAGDVELPATGSEPVRLALVDTAATRENGAEKHPGTSPHGFTLANMAKRLACGGPGGSACVAKVSSRLALAWTCFDPMRLHPECRDTARGGLYGLIGEMAEAVHAEVQHWRAVGPRRLVLNISAGWDPLYGGLEPVPADTPAPVAAVQAAIRDAVCRGAAVVAAAGNREGGPTTESGPILPAAWETKPAPAVVHCKSLGLSPNPADFVAPYRPLVFAVGGVRAGDGPLYNSRDAAEPRLAAFADHGVVAAAAGGPTATLTGSSVATLLVSASASAAAYYRPELSVYDDLEAVYRAGRGLGRAADFCQGGAPCPNDTFTVRRASLCGTLSYVCRSKARFCPASPPACPAAAPLDLSGVDLTRFDDPTFAAQVDLTAIGQTDAPIDECRLELLRHPTGPMPTDPCPHWQYFSPAPAGLTGPQPGSYPCPNCTYGAVAGELFVEIDDGFAGTLTDGTLKCGAETWNLGLGTLVAGAAVHVTGFSCPTATPVQLSFTLAGDSSATSPILVEP